MRRPIVLALAFLCACSSEAKQEPRGDSPPSPIAFAPGQVWSYRARPGEEASQALVFKVDPDPRLGEIVHFKIRNLPKDTWSWWGGEVQHVPLSRQASRASVVRLLETIPPPKLPPGYQGWAKVRTVEDPQTFTRPLDEAMQMVFERFEEMLGR